MSIRSFALARDVVREMDVLAVNTGDKLHEKDTHRLGGIGKLSGRVPQLFNLLLGSLIREVHRLTCVEDRVVHRSELGVIENRGAAGCGDGAGRVRVDVQVSHARTLSGVTR